MTAMARPRLALVAAVARNGIVGRDGGLPWHLPEDLRHFRTLTQGHPVVMGRRTWDSLPPRFRPLPGRRNVVVTRQPAWAANGAEAVASLPAALALLRGVGQVFVIGGAELYAAALPLADALELTEIDRDYEGDVSFPDVGRAAWTEVRREVHAPGADGTPPYAFVSYVRRPTA